MLLENKMMMMMTISNFHDLKNCILQFPLLVHNRLLALVVNLLWSLHSHRLEWQEGQGVLDDKPDGWGLLV